jgi:hypothetical protein
MGGLRITFVLGLLIVPLAIARMRTDRQAEGLVGPVRTIHIEASRFSNQYGQWVEEPREFVAFVSYNVRGNKTEMVPGQTTLVWLFEGISLDKKVYTYDARGNLIRIVSYNPDGSLLSKTVYTYSDKKNLQQVASYNHDGSLSSKSVYAYGPQGKLTEAIYYDAWGDIVHKVVYTYDDKGHLTEEIICGSSGITGRSVHTYDAQGRRIETTRYDLAHGAGLGIDRTVETYDANSNILELTTYYTEKVGDEEGKPILPPSKRIYAYEWDAQGNWVKQTQALCTSETGKPSCEPSLATYRTITYYSEAETPGH